MWPILIGESVAPCDAAPCFAAVGPPAAAATAKALPVDAAPATAVAVVSLFATAAWLPGDARAAPPARTPAAGSVSVPGAVVPHPLPTTRIARAAPKPPRPYRPRLT